MTYKLYNIYNSVTALIYPSNNKTHSLTLTCTYTYHSFKREQIIRNLTLLTL
jgi:hypothetical protein